MQYTAYLVLIGVAGAVGDVLLYQGAKTSRPPVLAAGLVTWIVCLLLFAYFIRWSGYGLSVSFVLIAAIHTLIVLGWDCYYLETRLTPREWAGVVLAVLGMLLIESRS